MDQDCIVMSYIMLELTDCFQERLAFDITYRTTDFDDGNSVLSSMWIAVKTALNLICNMRNYLNSSSAEITTAFFLKYRPVNLYRL